MLISNVMMSKCKLAVLFAFGDLVAPIAMQLYKYVFRLTGRGSGNYGFKAWMVGGVLVGVGSPVQVYQ